MRLNPIITAIVVICWTAPAAAVQCEVTTQAELLAALQCYANSCSGGCATCPGGCPTEIVVPYTEAIDIDTTIALTSAHDGLTLTIAGTLTWTGGTGDGYYFISITGASDITIQGGGGATPSLITSDYEPCVPGNPGAGGLNFIVSGIVPSSCNGITIQNLNFSRLSHMVLTDSGAQNQNLTFAHLIGEEMARYGMFIGGSDDMVTLNDCHIYQMCNEHGFRIYANNVTIVNCSSYGNGNTKIGLWLVGGEDFTVDGFTSDDQRMEIGPNHACLGGGGPDTGERVLRVDARNIEVTTFEVKNGTIGCYLENVDTAQIGIGRLATSTNNTVPRPINRVFWKNLSVTPILAEPTGTGCMGSEVGEFTCFGDVDGDENVNVNDLLAVINNWGACEVWDEALGGECGDLPECITPVPCIYDISPQFFGDGTVNVNDLLAVINNWGTCTTFSNPPSVYEDCIDYVTNVLELDPETKEWAEEYDLCVESNGGFAE